MAERRQGRAAASGTSGPVVPRRWLIVIGLSLGIPSLVGIVSAQTPFEKGKALYLRNCAPCHGEKGTGTGPDAAGLPSKPADFTNKSFWQDEKGKGMTNVVGMGKGSMPAISLKADELKDVMDYMASAFGPGR